MDGQPETWHYGLIARWWAEFNEPDLLEVTFYQDIIKRRGEPALDLACGAGRLLLPMLQAGLDVDGCDISADMLAHCAAAASRHELTPHLFQQPMHGLELPRRYRTIYMCDSFGLGGQRKQDAEALRRCYDHLALGGTLVFSHYLPNDNQERWQYWLRKKREQLPEPWTTAGMRKKAANGDEIELRARVVNLDPMEQRLTLEMRAELWRDGRLRKQEERLLQENLYFRNEILLLLANVGFSTISVRAGYSATEASADDTMLVFVASK